MSATASTFTRWRRQWDQHRRLHGTRHPNTVALADDVRYLAGVLIGESCS